MLLLNIKPAAPIENVTGVRWSDTRKAYIPHGPGVESDYNGVDYCWRLSWTGLGGTLHRYRNFCILAATGAAPGRNRTLHAEIIGLAWASLEGWQALEVGLGNCFGYRTFLPWHDVREPHWVHRDSRAIQLTESVNSRETWPLIHALLYLSHSLYFSLANQILFIVRPPWIYVDGYGTEGGSQWENHLPRKHKPPYPQPSNSRNVTFSFREIGRRKDRLGVRHLFAPLKGMSILTLHWSFARFRINVDQDTSECIRVQ